MAKTVVVGLDIGTTHLRGAEVQRARSGGGATLIRYGEVLLPPGAVRDGEVAEPETVASGLRQLWRTAKFQSRDVVIGIGNQRVLVRDLDMPVMPLAQLRASLPFQVQDLLPVPVDDALLDFYPTSTFEGLNGPSVRGLLVAATKDTVRANTIAVESAGLRPVMVDLDAFALSRVLNQDDVGGAPVALVDIGARVTTIVVVAGGVPQFVRILPNGGDTITDSITATLSCSASEAELLKRQLGVGYQPPPEHAAAADAVSTVARVLVESIRHTLLYYASGHPGAGVEMVVMTGGGALLSGLGQFIASATRLPVRMGRPLASFRLVRSSPPPDSIARLQDTCAVAAGLALGVRE